MNEQLSILSLILSAGIVVQLVMLLLLVASVVSWVVIVQRGRILSANKAAMLEFEEQFWSGVDLNDLYKDCQEKLNPSAIEAIFMAGSAKYNGC